MRYRLLISIVIVFLVVMNLITAGLLVKAYAWDQMWLRNELWAQATTSGTMWSMVDFRADNLRQLRLVPAENGAIEDTGQRDGPFEIWTWTYIEGMPGSREAAEIFVNSYNSKMRYMYEHPDAYLEGVEDHRLHLSNSTLE